MVTTLKHAVTASPRSSAVVLKLVPSPSKVAERLNDPEFLLDWFRQPALNTAEAVIRLRRLRGLSQAELADKMSTKQPAIARIESGHSNVRLSTLVEIAVALDAIVSVHIEPQEVVSQSYHRNFWWQVGYGTYWNTPTPEIPINFDSDIQLTTDTESLRKRILASYQIDNEVDFELCEMTAE